MKDWDLAEDFRAIFAADGTFGSACVNAQADGDYARPAFVFSCRSRPLDATGHTIAYRLTVEVHTDANEVDGGGALIADTSHAARVSAVQRKFFGATASGAAAAKLAITSAMATRGHFTLRNYDAGTDEVEPGMEGWRFETTVGISGIARVVSV